MQHTPHIATAVILDAVYEHGTMNALEGYVSLKRLEADVAEALGKLKAKATEEAAAYGKGEHEAYGATIQHRASAGRWDFSALPWVKPLEEAQASLDMTRKAKEDMAKAAYNAQQKMQALPVDMETGEVIQPANYTPGKDVVAITLKKSKV